MKRFVEDYDPEIHYKPKFFMHQDEYQEEIQLDIPTQEVIVEENDVDNA